MKKKNYRPFFIVLIVSIIQSCSLKREDVVYFNNVENINTLVTDSPPKLQINDKIKISIYAADPSTTAPFNLGSSVNKESEGKSYIVDEFGEIDMPIIGKVFVKGLSRVEAQKIIEEKVAEYIKNPSVNLNFVDFKITVLGEVNIPGTKTLSTEKVTIIDALGLAGDLKLTGVRKNVMVIRNNEGHVQSYRVDLTNSDVFNSPVYYLAQNDIVYVEPDKAARTNASSVKTVSIVATVLAAIVSITTIITRLN